MILFLLICIVLLLIIIISWIQFINTKSKYNVKGPFPLPILGNAHMFIVDSSKFLKLLYKISQKYGDAFVVFFFSKPYVFLSHPKYIEPLVSSSELITKGRSYEFLWPWLGLGLLTATGQRWKTHRKFLTPAFHFNILQNFLPVFCRNGRILTDKLDELADGRSVSLFPIIALAALDNVTEAIMGVSVESQKDSNSEYVKSIEVVSEISSYRMQIALLGEDFIFNRTKHKKRQDVALKVLHTHTKNVIEERKRDLKRLNITSLKESNDLGIKNKHAFLDLLLLAEVDGKKFDEESVREEVDTFMFEGHDTTTSGIVYILYILSDHPETQEKILEEQKNILVDDLYRDPTFAELHEMKYLDLVIKEALRIFPPVPLIERRMTKDTEVGPLKLLKGTTCSINIFQMQRHPALYEDPLEFRPERFAPGSPESKNPFAYLVFSAGPRNCIGQKFALMEMKVTVAQIIKKFKLLPIKQEPRLSVDLVLRSKNGIHVAFSRR